LSAVALELTKRAVQPCVRVLKRKQESRNF